MPSASYLPIFANIVGLTGIVAEASAIGQVAANAVQQEDTALVGVQAGLAALGLVDASLCYLILKEDLDSARRDSVSVNDSPAGHINPVSRAMSAVLTLLTVIEFLQFVSLLNGFGPSDAGEDFINGANKFSRSVSNFLTEADPISWSGAGEAEYKKQNDYQKNRVSNIAKADWKIVEILKFQARQVERARAELIIITLGLGRTLYKALEWYFECAEHRAESVYAASAGNAELAAKEYAEAMKLANQLWWLVSVIALAVAGTVLYLLEHLCYEVSDRAKNHLQGARENYGSIFGDALKY